MACLIWQVSGWGAFAAESTEKNHFIAEYLVRSRRISRRIPLDHTSPGWISALSRAGGGDLAGRGQPSRPDLRPSRELLLVRPQCRTGNVYTTDQVAACYSASRARRASRSCACRLRLWTRAQKGTSRDSSITPSAPTAGHVSRRCARCCRRFMRGTPRVCVCVCVCVCVLWYLLRANC